MAKLPNLTMAGHHTKLTMCWQCDIGYSITKHYHRLPSVTWARLVWYNVPDDHALNHSNGGYDLITLCEAKYLLVKVVRMAGIAKMRTAS